MDESLLKVLAVTVDPLTLIATLADGVKLLGTEVTRKSHADHEGTLGAKLGWRVVTVS